MPPDREAYCLGLQAIDEISIHEQGRPFLEIGPREQDEVLRLLHDGKPSAAHEIWQRMPVHRFWMLLVADCVDAYYSHPWAWDEIGFGGPAYPRAYMRLERGEAEPWESEEKRYPWRAHDELRVKPIRRSRRAIGASRITRAGRDALKSPVFGEFQPPGSKPHMLGPMQRIKTPMHHFADGEEVDYVIVGIGAGGGVLLQRLARAGFRVLGFDAGPFWDTERDWVSDEKGAHNLYWNDMRITTGEHPLAFGANNSGKGVGGGTVHWAAFTPRLHPSDFRIQTQDGVGVDWPITYSDLKPYYELLELELPVSGPSYYPWGDPHGYPYGPHPMGGVGDTLDSRLYEARHPRFRWRPGSDFKRFARRPAALHLSWILYPGMQGGGKGQHSYHACTGRNCQGSRDPSELHGFTRLPG